MTEDYSISYIEQPDDAIWTAIGGGLHQYNIEQAGDPQGKRLCYVLYAPDGQVAGGLIGETHWDWFYISLMFLKEELRGAGYGHQLLELAEKEARQRGAKNVYLDTFSFQAPDFYKSHGYEVYGVLQDFPPGHKRLFFAKQL